MATRTVTVSEARANLKELLDFVQDGGTVVIRHYTTPIAQLAPIENDMNMNLWSKTLSDGRTAEAIYAGPGVNAAPTWDITIDGEPYIHRGHQVIRGAATRQRSHPEISVYIKDGRTGKSIGLTEPEHDRLLEAHPNTTPAQEPVSELQQERDALVKTSRIASDREFELREIADDTGDPTDDQQANDAVEQRKRAETDLDAFDAAHPEFQEQLRTNQKAHDRAAAQRAVDTGM